MLWKIVIKIKPRNPRRPMNECRWFKLHRVVQGCSEHVSFARPTRGHVLQRGAAFAAEAARHTVRGIIKVTAALPYDLRSTYAEVAGHWRSSRFSATFAMTVNG